MSVDEMSVDEVSYRRNVRRRIVVEPPVITYMLSSVHTIYVCNSSFVCVSLNLKYMKISFILLFYFPNTNVRKLSLRS